MPAAEKLLRWVRSQRPSCITRFKHHNYHLAADERELAMQVASLRSNRRRAPQTASLNADRSVTEEARALGGNQ